MFCDIPYFESKNKNTQEDNKITIDSKKWDLWRSFTLKDLLNFYQDCLPINHMANNTMFGQKNTNKTPQLHLESMWFISLKQHRVFWDQFYKTMGKTIYQGKFLTIRKTFKTKNKICFAVTFKVVGAIIYNP